MTPLIGGWHLASAHLEWTRGKTNDAGKKQNIAHLSLGRMAAVEFPLPSWTEQKRIVEEVVRRLSLVRGAEIRVNANLKHANVLRNAVLTKLFG